MVGDDSRGGRDARLPSVSSLCSVAYHVWANSIRPYNRKRGGHVGAYCIRPFDAIACAFDRIRHRFFNCEL